MALDRISTTFVSKLIISARTARRPRLGNFAAHVFGHTEPISAGCSARNSPAIRNSTTAITGFSVFLGLFFEPHAWATAVPVDELADTPPKVVNALSSPANQCSCFSARNARTCSRRECPSVATNTNALIFVPPISTRRSPKSICN